MGEGNRVAKIDELERRIEYHFASPEFLAKALTHASASKPGNHGHHYERLEFLGDRVLGLVVSVLLFETFPKAAEGELSLRLNALVNGKTCAEVADEIELYRFIRAGADLKHLTSKRMRGVRADVMEALIAAIYLDGGLEAASAVVRRLWQSRLHLADAARRDSKTAVQEWAHANQHGTPRYEIIEQQGPDHDPVFTVKINLINIDSETGSGHSKRSAEQQAAKKVLERENVWPGGQETK